MSIKAFVFDCGGVLLSLGASRTYQTWAERLGMAPEDLSRHLWEDEPWAKAEVGEITEDDYWRLAGEKLGISDEGVVAQLRAEMWDAWSIDQGVVELVDEIRGRYPVAILSNASDALEEMLEHRYGVAHLFAHIFNSARLGVAKPDQAIYEIMLQRLDAKPQEIVFIDDRAENVTAAACMGMHVVWYVNPCELRRQLAVYLKNGHKPAGAEAVAQESATP